MSTIKQSTLRYSYVLDTNSIVIYRDDRIDSRIKTHELTNNAMHAIAKQTVEAMERAHTKGKEDGKRLLTRAMAKVLDGDV